jgi:hypothetical protein
VQAGLFSAILTAFIIEFYKDLKQDPMETSTQLLLRITMQLDNSAHTPIDLPKEFTPSATNVAVNALWFSSLILSLFASLLGILVKQWLHVYTKWPDREQPRDTIILRYIYQEGFFRWHVQDIIGLLPVLLQVALLLFVVGLVTYMWTLNRAIACVLSVLVATTIVVAVVSIALPFFSEDCPYKSPVGLFIAGLKAKYINGSTTSDLSSWQRRDLVKAKPYIEISHANDVVAQSGLLLDMSPRIDLEKALEGVIDNNSLLGSRISGLSERMQRLLFELVVSSTRTKSKSAVSVHHPHHALHLLEYMSQKSKGSLRQEALGAATQVINVLDTRLVTGLDAVGGIMVRHIKEDKSM